MSIRIVRNDITKMNVDAIVNAANASLSGGGGVDGAIHRAAGAELLKECMTLGGCKTGDAKITGAYDLPCKYVIHTVGPVWEGGNKNEKKLLESCYRNSLKLAKEYDLESVAFPLISSGVYGYPKDQALRVAVDAISGFLADNDMTVYIVVFDKAAHSISEKLFSDIQAYIDDRYTEEYTFECENRLRDFWDIPFNRAQHCDDFEDGGFFSSFASSETEFFSQSESCFSQSEPLTESLDDSFDFFENTAKALPGEDLASKLMHLDESFSEMLIRLIDEKGMSDAECYKKANIDRKLFSKIRSDVHYKPSKSTVIAFAIALELPLEETKNMLEKAGFALSHSKKFDIIIEYFITKGNYNIFEINEALFSFDQTLLGA